MKEPTRSLTFFCVSLITFFLFNEFVVLSFSLSIESGTTSGIWTTAPSFILMAFGLYFASKLHGYFSNESNNLNKNKNKGV